MAIEEKIIAGIVYYGDDQNKVLFTRSEMLAARDRYAKELAKKLANQG